MKRHLSRLGFVVGVSLAVSAISVCAAETESGSTGRFEITRFEVDGNTLLPEQSLQPLLARFTGANRDFGDVQRALEALEEEYRKHGFNLVQVVLPEQELNQGVVHLKVIQSRIGKVTIEGNNAFDNDNIRRSLPPVKEGETPNIARISSALRMANENPAKKVNLQLQSGDQDGEVDAALKVTEDKTWKIGANVDNTGTDSTGKTHVGLVYQNANMSGHDDVASLQYTTSAEKPSKVSIYGAGYHLPLYGLSSSIDLYGSYSNVDSGSVSAGIFDLQVSGRGSVYGARYNLNFDRSGDYDSKLTAGIDYKAYKNDVQLLSVQLGNDVTVHPFSLGYSGSWTKPAGAANFYFTGYHNIPGGDKGREADFNLARSGAPAKYNILRYGASLTHSLSSDWQVRLNMNGQYSRDALVPGEQFGAGGANSVRGFTEREVSDDTGYAGSVELYTPNFCANIGWTAAQCRVLAFYDGAYLRRNSPLPGELARTSIGSTGLGLRVAMDKYLMLQVDYGLVVDAGGSRARGDKRLHFAVGLMY